MSKKVNSIGALNRITEVRILLSFLAGLTGLSFYSKSYNNMTRLRVLESWAALKVIGSELGKDDG
jgi:hypothetical protein